MTSAGTPMLADFGHSRSLNYSNIGLITSSYGRLKGTTHWIAYELLEALEDPSKTIVCTEASDMWAYGMVLYVRLSMTAPSLNRRIITLSPRR